MHDLAVSKETRPEQERRIPGLIRDSSGSLVLARYMQILWEDLLTGYGKDLINIHHSFLASFMGANPCRQACDRGVKIIGATAHFAASKPDEGPVIDQAVAASRTRIKSIR